MAAPDLQAVAEGIADTVRTATLDAHPFVPPQFGVPPALYVPVPTDMEQLTFTTDGGIWLLRYELLLVVADAWSESAHADVLGFLPGIKSRLQAAQTLGGAAQGVFVQTARTDANIRPDRDDGTEYFGARIDLEVHT